MDQHAHNQMEILTAEQIERIYRVTDQLGLSRDWVVVPLNAAESGVELVHPDGKLLIRPPRGEAFEAWLGGLSERLQALDLGRAAKRWENDPKFPLTGPGEFHAWGTRRYLHDRGILRR
ncbi:MAG TPA: hypothetical protein VNM14_02215 [Planctomycetota bacterium]|jgi:hypothetical protein|nr:hypothetical protein [Planctomycetota bacterium]